MGRDAPSVGQPPAAFRKNVRSKKARATLNKTIPALVTTHPRAKRGIDSSELVLQPQAQKLPQDVSSKDKNAAPKAVHPDPQLKLRVTDTLTAANELLRDPTTQKLDSSNRNAKVDDFYRLPELGGIYTPDVLVFRDEQDNDIEKRDRWFVDCVSAGMLRFPNVTVDEKTGRGSYTNSKDRDLVLEKMRAVMRMFHAKGVAKVVVGAWGCGAFGNPVGEIAAAWRKVLLGGSRNKGKREVFAGIDVVVFAIKDAGLADAFGKAFGVGLVLEDLNEESSEEIEEEEAMELEKLREVREKIADMRLRIQQARSPELKAGLSSILAGLEAQSPNDASVERDGKIVTDEDDTDTDGNSSDSDTAYDSTKEQRTR